jgi:hypothetical protein
MVAEAELKAFLEPEKFRIMEILRKDLLRNDSMIPSPKWHDDAPCQTGRQFFRLERGQSPNTERRFMSMKIFDLAEADPQVGFV